MKATVEAEVTQLRQSLGRALADVQEARRSAAEAVRLRQVTEQAVQEAEALRPAEVARVAAQVADADRPAMVASKIDEVQFRRLQEAEQARKSLGLLARLRAAWRGE